MGADERFRMAKAQRERNEFDGQLAMAVKRGDDRAMPADKFGLTVKPGVMLMHFSGDPTPPVVTVTQVQPVLDPRAPAGMLRVRMVYDIYVPSGVPNPHLLVVGDAPVEEETPTTPPETTINKVSDEEPPAEPTGPKLVLTDAQ